jgi:hypothetical protein
LSKELARRPTVVDGTATAVSGRVARRQQARYADQDQTAYQARARPSPPPAAAPAERENMVELTQLAQFRDQGILTPEECAVKKKQLLGLW